MKKLLIRASLAILAGMLLFAVPSFAADTGADLFKTKCAACHAANGSGDTVMGKKMNVRDLGSAEVQKQSDAELSGIIEKGKNKMPAYEGKLSKDQVQDLVKYIRSLKK